MEENNDEGFNQRKSVRETLQEKIGFCPKGKKIYIYT